MIKVVLAKTVIDYMQLNGGNPQTAAERGIETLKRKADGDGGVIVLTPRGDFGIAFNTPRMARAYINETMDSPVVAV
jgi:beta-aspartyl-peptidase (threonine type)